MSFKDKLYSFFFEEGPEMSPALKRNLIITAVVIGVPIFFYLYYRAVAPKRRHRLREKEEELLNTLPTIDMHFADSVLLERSKREAMEGFFESNPDIDTSMLSDPEAVKKLLEDLLNSNDSILRKLENMKMPDFPESLKQ